MSRRAADVLEFIKDFEQCAMKNAIAVVESGGNESIYQSFSNRKGRAEAFPWLCARGHCHIERGKGHKIGSTP